MNTEWATGAWVVGTTVVRAGDVVGVTIAVVVVDELDVDVDGTNVDGTEVDGTDVDGTDVGGGVVDVVVEVPNDATEPVGRGLAMVVVVATTTAGGDAHPDSTSTTTMPTARRPRWTHGTTQFTCRVFPAQNGSRSLNFCSFPVAVRASASRNSTRLGHL